MSNRASYRTNSAWLGKEFGEQMARRHFGDEAVDALPRYVRGKNKGKFKAEIQWIKVERGGWVNQGSDDAGAIGFVENRVGDVIAVRLIQREWGTGHVSEVYAIKDDPRGAQAFSEQY